MTGDFSFCIPASRSLNGVVAVRSVMVHMASVALKTTDVKLRRPVSVMVSSAINLKVVIGLPGLINGIEAAMIITSGKIIAVLFRTNMIGSFETWISAIMMGKKKM